MKKLGIVFISIACLFFTTFVSAAVITLTLDSVPTDLDCDTDCLCDKNWVESNITMRVTSTTTNVPCDPNCSWEHAINLFGPYFDRGVLLHPGQLIVDLSSINEPITNIEVWLEDYCPPPEQMGGTGCSLASIYDGATQIAIKTSSSDQGPIYESGNFIFDQTISGINTVDKLIVASCNGHIGEIRITTMPSPTSSTCGTDCGTTYSTCGIGCGTTSSTCGIGCVTYSTCGIFCGTTFNTCGIFCGTTFNTCGIGCGTTSSTCGIGCGTTFNTCGIGCGTTSSTCGTDCGTTYSTCGIGCGATYSTCGIFCGTTFNTCGGENCVTTSATCELQCIFNNNSEYSYTDNGPAPPPAF